VRCYYGGRAGRSPDTTLQCATNSGETTVRPSWAVTGVAMMLFDPCSQDAIDLLSRSSHVLCSIPPLGLPLYDPVRLATVWMLLCWHDNDALGFVQPLICRLIGSSRTNGGA